MRIYRLIKEYKDFFIGAGVFILFLFLKDKGSIFQYFPVVSLAFVIIVIAFGVVSLFYRHFFETKYTVQEFLKDLNQNILFARRPFVIQVRNAHIPGLVKPLSKAVHSEHWWDWSYFGVHPDCGGFCANVCGEIENCYLTGDVFKNTKTSTLRLIEDYPLGTRSEIFFGEIGCMPKFAKPSQFRPELIEAVEERQYELFFRELYIFDSSWDNSERTCQVSKPRRLIDTKKIIEEWSRLQGVLISPIQKAKELVWKNAPPDESDRSAFIQALEEMRIKNCREKFIAVTPGSGRLKPILSLLRNQSFLSRFLILFGWILSPLTLWNDSIVNIPISFGFAPILASIFGLDYYWSVGLAYLFSNVLGMILLMVGIAMIPQTKILRVNYRNIIIMFVILIFMVLVTYCVQHRAVIPFWFHEIIKNMQILL